MDIKMDSLGDKIRLLRKSRGINQSHFAMLIKISQQTLSRYENNIVVPSLFTLQNIAEFCRIDINELLDTKEYKKDSENIEKINDMNKLVSYLADSNIIDPNNITPEIEKLIIDSVKNYFETTKNLMTALDNNDKLQS